MQLKTGAQKQIVKLANYLLSNKFPHAFFKLVSCFNPKHLFASDSEGFFQRLADHVGFGLDRVRIHVEVVTLKNLEAYNQDENDMQLYERIFAQHNFDELRKLYNIVITVSHSNAESERRFNLSNEILTENRANLSEELFNQRKNIVNGSCFTVTTSKSLSPHKIYCLERKQHVRLTLKNLRQKSRQRSKKKKKKGEGAQ